MINRIQYRPVSTCLFNILYGKWEQGVVSYSISAAHQSFQLVLRENTVLWTELTYFLIELHLFLKEKLTNYDIENEGWHFLKNEWSETITSGKIAHNMFASECIWDLKWKLEFFKNMYVLPWVCLPILTDFSKETRSDINKCDLKKNIAYWASIFGSSA